MADKKDLYGILGVTQGKAATADEIKKAYRIAVMKHHPDRNGGSDESKKKFQDINEANRVLSDDKLRPIYDRSGYEAVVDFEANGSASNTGNAAADAAAARQRKKYTADEAFSFFDNDGKPPQPQSSQPPRSETPRPAQTSSSSAGGSSSDAIRNRLEQMKRAMGGGGNAAPQRPAASTVDTAALTRIFNSVGQQTSAATSDLRGANATPQTLTDEARLALDSAHAKARELVREIESWKTKFKR